MYESSTPNIKPMTASILIIFESTIVLYRPGFDREPLGIYGNWPLCDDNIQYQAYDG